MYTRRTVLKTAGLGLAAMCLSPLETLLAAQDKSKDSPRYNVVFILADDLGWKDCSAYGSKFLQTPNIDRLTKKGMLFTEAYAASPVCSPTRASILTGLWPARIGITRPECHYPEEIFKQTINPISKPYQKCLQPISVTRLKTEYFTLAEAFKANGYATAHLANGISAKNRTIRSIRVSTATFPIRRQKAPRAGILPRGSSGMDRAGRVNI